MSIDIPHEEYEKARKNVRSKKKVYWHFVIFLIGSVFLILLNTVFGVGEQYGDWFVWGIGLWLFLWVLHFVNVFFFKRFFNKEWERRETEKLLEKHRKKVEKLERKLIDEGVISPGISEKKNPGESS